MASPIRPSVGIRIRTLALLSVVMNTPVVAWVTRRLTSEPRVEVSEIGGTSVSILHPAGRGPWPAIMFVNGAQFLKKKREVDPDERFQSEWYRHYRTMFAAAHQH